MSLTMTLHPDFQALKNDVLKSDEYFEASSHSIHKARNELRVTTLQSIEVVIKAFKIPNIINQIAYTYLRHSKAFKSYHNALRLTQLGVTTPTPIAFLEERHFTLFKRSYFLSRYTPYDFTMAHIRDDQPIYKNDVLRAFARFTKELHDKGVWHEDYSAGNILVTKTQSSYHFCLVDINRMKFMPISTTLRMKNFNKLWLNEEDLQTIAKAYADEATLEPSWCVKTVLDFDRKHKAKIERKRALKATIKRWL